MRANYRQTYIKNDREIVGPSKEIVLPFSRASARAIILRRSDGAILGALHVPGGKFALPGGDIDDGESPEDAVLRELEEENIQLHGFDDTWKEQMEVHYFDGYRELTHWYLFVVDDANVGECEENIEVRWIAQTEDPWHPFMRKQILLVIERFTSDFLKAELEIRPLDCEDGIGNQSR